MTDIQASLVATGWRRVDIKLTIDGELHVVRWRRRWLLDEVLFDDRRVGVATGLFDRESIYGLDVKLPDEKRVRLLLTIDPTPDWNDPRGAMGPGGVRLETGDATLLASGVFGPERPNPFNLVIDRALKSLGLS